jgi:hypothetical protein
MNTTPLQPFLPVSSTAKEVATTILAAPYAVVHGDGLQLIHHSRAHSHQAESGHLRAHLSAPFESQFRALPLGDGQL